LRIALDRRELTRESIRLFDAQTAIEVALAGRVTTGMWVDERPVPAHVRLASDGDARRARVGLLADLVRSEVELLIALGRPGD
jgi:cobalt-zinc-cadmium resistance protein CzcA